MDPFLGQIILFAGNFAPRGWALCEGQLLSINDNQALFSLYGTTYGGDGRTTFALPDLRGRAPVSQGQGPGLSTYKLGQKGGSETNTITINEMPSHNHTVHIPMNISETGEPSGVLGNGDIYAEEATTGANYAGASSTHTGSNIPVNNIQPYLAMNYIVALQGVYPSRS